MFIHTSRKQKYLLSLTQTLDKIIGPIEDAGPHYSEFLMDLVYAAIPSF